MKEKNANLFVAVLVIIGFVFFWDSFVVSRFAHKKGDKQASKTTSTLQPSTIGNPQISPKIDTATPIIQKVLENDLNKITFDTTGAKVVSWRLHEKDRWIDLVLNHPDIHGAPLETYPDINFTIESVGQEKIVFKGILPTGVVVRKVFELSRNSFFSKLSIAYQNPTKVALPVSGNIPWSGGLFKKTEGKKEDHKKSISEVRAVAMAEQARSWKSGVIFGKNKNENISGSFKWIGVDNEHFLAAIAPVEGPLPTIHVQFDKTTPPSISVPIDMTLQPKELKTLEYHIYVGPKKMEYLLNPIADLRPAIDYGFIEKGLLFSLQFLNRFTSNYGWAIIILTIIVQILMYPLTKRSLKSSLRMKEIQF